MHRRLQHVLLANFDDSDKGRRGTDPGNIIGRDESY
jgi:hypothetical protein